MQRFAPWLLAAASGAAFALALPGAGWQPLVLLFPGLLLEAIERSPGGRRPFLVGWFAGIVHWTIAVNWVLPVMDHYGGMPTIAALGCLVGMGEILGSCWALAAWLSSLAPTRLRVWLFPAAFIALDAWRQFWPLASRGTRRQRWSRRSRRCSARCRCGAPPGSAGPWSRPGRRCGPSPGQICAGRVWLRWRRRSG